MAEYTITARPSGSSKNNSASRILSDHLAYDPTQHRTISGITRRDGVWCSCGGSSQRVVLNGYDRLIDTQTGEIIKKSSTGSCTCRGSGPGSENYMTCTFADWTEDESNLAITLWAAGRLKITRTVWIKSYTSSGHGSPSFRDGYYNDDITITGSTQPFTSYAPAITAFELLRSADGVTPDDMSTTVWARIRLSMADTAGLGDSPMLMLYHSVYQSMSGADAVELTGLSIADCLSADQLIRLGTAYGIGSNHYFRLIFSAGNEVSPQAAASVGMAYVPLHVNANNHGVAVGGYSNATAQDERFESMWQAFFHAGISGVTNYESGEVPTGGKWVDGYPIYRYVYAGTSSVSGTSGTVCRLPAVPGTLLELKAFATMNAAQTQWGVIPYSARVTTAWNAEIYMVGADVFINWGANWGSNRRVIVIAEYTKEA